MKEKVTPDGPEGQGGKGVQAEKSPDILHKMLFPLRLQKSQKKKLEFLRSEWLG